MNKDHISTIRQALLNGKKILKLTELVYKSVEAGKAHDQHSEALASLDKLEGIGEGWISVKERLPIGPKRMVAFLYHPEWAPFKEGLEPFRNSACWSTNITYDVTHRKDGTVPFASHWQELPPSPEV